MEVPSNIPAHANLLPLGMRHPRPARGAPRPQLLEQLARRACSDDFSAATPAAMIAATRRMAMRMSCACSSSCPVVICEVGPVEDLGGVFYASFADPDGNTWTLQHMPWRI
jgi:hypothetical protein